MKVNRAGIQPSFGLVHTTVINTGDELFLAQCKDFLTDLQAKKELSIISAQLPLDRKGAYSNKKSFTVFVESNTNQLSTSNRMEKDLIKKISSWARQNKFSFFVRQVQKRVKSARSV